MNGKKKALKALVVLAVVIALCMFFSRTVQTITTPKVQRISATKGKLEEKISLSASIYFPETTAVFVKDAKKLGLTVGEVKVRAGYQVKEGDVIFTADAPEYETKRKELKASYDKKVRELAEERASHVRIASTSTQNDRYNLLMDAYDKYYSARYEAYRTAKEYGFLLPGLESIWDRLVDAPQAVADAAKKALDAKKYLDECEKTLRSIYNTGKDQVNDTTFEHIKKMDNMHREIGDLQDQLLELDALYASLQEIKAPHDGYITEIAVKQGESYDGSKAAYTISAAGAGPVLRADVTNVTKSIAAGNKVTLESGATTELQSIEIMPTGQKYALIKLSSAVLKAGGGMSRMISETAIPLTLTYKAAKNTTLLPASAVRQDSDGSYYVYTISRSYGGGILSSGDTIVKKTAVTVLEKTDKMVSLADDLQYTEIADREDRALTDGQAVMDYVD